MMILQRSDISGSFFIPSSSCPSLLIEWRASQRGGHQNYGMEWRGSGEVALDYLGSGGDEDIAMRNWKDGDTMLSSQVRHYH